MMDLTVVVVSYETANLLVECLDSLMEARRSHPDFRFEVIVVDNGSRDESVAWAREHPLGPRLVAGIRNRGFAAAVNSGLRLRRGRHALLLNSDVRIERDLLVGAVAILDGHEEIGVLGPSLLYPDGRAQRSVHRLPSFRTECIPEWLTLGLKKRPARADSGRLGEVGGPEEVEAIRGAVFFICGTVLAKVGPFDEGYFFFLEETDYCARVRGAGFRVAYSTSLRATHQLGASSKQRVPLATRIEYHRSLYRFFSKRRGSSAVIAIRILRGLRNAGTVAGLGLPALVFPSARRRWTERTGLLLWHLRGCPADPNLAEALLQRGR